ncbi:hypothetical protein [Nocardia sp. NPDC051832]|uniref:hypothetical protein n=1 Tax=Nocardia sp. NPDC051832 TaxID=3155673 RepID=UPI0034399FD6
MAVKTNISDLLTHMTSESYTGWLNTRSEQSKVRDMITTIDAFGIPVGKAVTEAAANLDAVVKRYDAVVEKLETRALTIEDYEHKDHLKIISENAAKEKAHEHAVSLREEAIEEASNQVRVAAYASIRGWMEGLNSIYAKEHDGLYLAEENSPYEPPIEGIKRAQRRETLDGLYQELRELGNLGKLEAHTLWDGMMISRYEFTGEQIALTGGESNIRNIGAPDGHMRGMAELASSVGAKPRLFVGTPGEFREEVARVRREAKIAVGGYPEMTGHEYGSLRDYFIEAHQADRLEEHKQSIVEMSAAANASAKAQAKYFQEASKKRENQQ